MTPASFFALLLPLGLGGFDPAPALIAAVFLSSGAETALASRRRGVLLFGLVLIGGTALWGLTLTSLVGASIAQIPWAEVVHAFLYAGVWTALGKGALALGLVAFGAYKLRSKPDSDTKERGFWGLLLVALGFVAIVTADLPFITTVAPVPHVPGGATAPRRCVHRLAQSSLVKGSPARGCYSGGALPSTGNQPGNRRPALLSSRRQKPKHL